MKISTSSKITTHSHDHTNPQLPAAPCVGTSATHDIAVCGVCYAYEGGGSRRNVRHTPTW